MAMAKASSASADKVADYGVAIDRSSELDGYTVNFVTITQSHDLGPMLASLPGGNCSCPHWGYVLKGKMIVRYSDREEIIEAGEAFYMPPGHAPEAERRDRSHPVQPDRPARCDRSRDRRGYAG
jgi:hypothetical protein